MRVLLWHVHGSWTTSFVQGGHDYLLPVTPDRCPDGLGRARTWDWPGSVVEVPVAEMRDCEPDVVVLQRPHEAVLVEQWTGRRPGVDLPAVYLEHNTPLHGHPDVPDTRHPMADQDGVPVVHVTGFNDLFWDCGEAPTRVIDHGVVDPGPRWTGELPHAAVVVNDPVRRGRSVGADLLEPLAHEVPVDVFGMRVEALPGLLASSGWPRTAGLVAHEDLPQDRMHRELARRAVYVHTARWTSLGLSLVEAMHLGMPVVALATTEAVVAVPPEAGILTTRRDELAAAVRHFVSDPAAAAAAGAAARRHALEHYALAPFLAAWDDVLGEVTRTG
jgi:glycosyltransferase involved in cell wall biosynthesis